VFQIKEKKHVLMQLILKTSTENMIIYYFLKYQTERKNKRKKIKENPTWVKKRAFGKHSCWPGEGKSSRLILALGRGDGQLYDARQKGRRGYRWVQGHQMKPPKPGKGCKDRLGNPSPQTIYSNCFFSTACSSF
jgi:hypothetical protein